MAGGAATARRRGHRQLPRLGVRRRPVQGRHRCADRLRTTPTRSSSSRRTYLTEGLRDLIGRAVRAAVRGRQRLAGDQSPDQLRRRQDPLDARRCGTSPRDCPLGDFPQETQELLAASGLRRPRARQPRRAGRQPLQPSGEDQAPTAPRSTRSGASSPGSSAAPRRTRWSPTPTATGTTPGEALHDLLAAYAPAVILIDEWVAYARHWSAATTWPAARFDDQFTFAQSLTEAVKGTPGVLLAISIPASESGDDDDKLVAGNAEEVGGRNGLEALKRLQNVVRRVADQWRPASSDEAYHIVKQRLFIQPDAAALGRDRCDGPGVRRDVPQVHRRLPPRGPRLAPTRTGSSGPTRSTPSCSTGSTRTGRAWSGSSAPAACCG